ncbi:MAG: 5-formyltetrahydrofolate cyclo-ligase [Acidimicrobiia bacterium]|nr:5-formyltetrahydrofolate cyclo-ligase [Acidimicrobiia bacterium]
MMGQPEGADKADWREWARRARESIDFPGISTAVVDTLAAWPGLRAARTVLTYFPLVDEVNLAPLLELDLGVEFLTTRTPDRDGTLTIHELGGPLEVHRFGFLQPHASAPERAPDDIDLILLPGLAFDLWGVRLGRGAGYYDELLSRVGRRAVRVGVIPAGLVVDRLPRDDHDQKVSFLGTEEGVIAVAGGA